MKKAIVIIEPKSIEQTPIVNMTFNDIDMTNDELVDEIIEKIREWQKMIKKQIKQTV